MSIADLFPKNPDYSPPSRPKSGEARICWACDVITPSNTLEWHHVLAKQIGGGNDVVQDDSAYSITPATANCVPLCKRCHDLVDRIEHKTWLAWAWGMQCEQPAPVWAKLTMLRQWRTIANLIAERDRKDIPV